MNVWSFSFWNISNQNKIDFQLDMLQLFQDLPWKEFPNIMSPGKNAMDLSRRFSSALKMTQ